MSSKAEKSNQFKWEWVCQIPKVALPTHKLPASIVQEHPLKVSASILAQTRVSNKKTDSAFSPGIMTDPLLSAFDGDDPLSAMAIQADWQDFEVKVEKKRTDPWEQQKAIILNKYVTNKKVSMTSGILSGLDRQPASPILQRETDPSGPKPTSLLGRHEQLDDFDEITMNEVVFYTQQEFENQLKNLNSKLTQMWNNDFRVKALKLSIQCSKLLVDSSVVQFYPSKFVLVTDILDEFGKLVYDRLKSKAESDTLYPSNLPPESAKETCRNWFYKIASIRELIPRLYVEAAVLQSYSFLSKSEFSTALKRLIAMVRGIGDPLVAVYARCNLCRISLSVANSDKEALEINFADFLMTYPKILSSWVLSELHKQNIDPATYLQSYVPAVDWITKYVLHEADENKVDQIVDKCCGLPEKGLLLHSLLNVVNSDYIIRKVLFFIRQISTCRNEYFPWHILIKQLGEFLKEKSVADPNKVYQEALGLLTKLTDPGEYLQCVLAWIEFIVSNSPIHDINDILLEMTERLSHVDKKPHKATIHEIILTIARGVPDLDSLFATDILPCLDLLGNDDIKVSAAKSILEIFTYSNKTGSVIDPVATDGLIFIAKILYDSVNILTVDDEKRQIGNLISQIIRKIDLGSDFEKHLSFYVEARATFTSLDSVIVTLVHCVNNLAMEVGKRVKSNHTKKTSAFVHTCVAYSFITIPSIRSVVTKLQLYLFTAQVALFNQCLGQADSCVKAALALISTLPDSDEFEGKSGSWDTFLLEYIRNTLSCLIVFPDGLDSGFLFLVRGLVNVLHQLPDEYEFVVSCLDLNILDTLAVCAQPEYPYSVKKVDSNNILYGGDPKFISYINTTSCIILEQILSNLERLGSKEEYKKQGQLAFGLFLRLIHHADLEAKGLAALAQRLWVLSHKHGSIDSLTSNEMLTHMKRKSSIYPANSAFTVLYLQLKDMAVQ